MCVGSVARHGGRSERVFVPVAEKVHMSHITPEVYDSFMSAVVEDMEVKNHHAAKVLAHVAYREGDGLTVIEVCETQADLDELTDFMMAHMDRMGIERPDIEPLDIHRFHV
jgi:hypothetical protein